MFRARRWLRLRNRRWSADAQRVAAVRVTGLRCVRAARGLWRVTADLPVAGLCVYWFVDGEFVRAARTPELVIGSGPAPRTIEALASRHADLSPGRWRRTPRGSRQALEWVRPAEDVDEYILESAPGESGGEWTEFARVRDTGAWSYRIATPPLTDCAWVRFRVRAVYAGNIGTATEWPARYVVRVPDQVALTTTVDESQQVTVSEVS